MSSTLKYKILGPILATGIAVGCASTKKAEITIDDVVKGTKTEQVAEEKTNAGQTVETPAEETKEIRYDPNNPQDLQKIIRPENRYHWKADAIIPETVSWYNASVLTLWTGFRNGDFVLVMHNDDGTHTVAERAKINFYPELKAATIAYKINGRWYETTPNDPEGNIDFNKTERGGIYKTTNMLTEWPEDPLDALLHEWYDNK